jgi:hypothetical protein
VPAGNEILRQLEGMVFGDESADKPKPDDKSKTDGKKERKKWKEDS